MNIILASSSTARQQLLKQLHLSFEVRPSHIDESPLNNEQPQDLVLRLAQAKAEKVAKKNCITIGSDQLAVCNDKILGKPGNEQNAIKQLQQMSGQTVSFLTAVTVIAPDLSMQSAIEQTKVSMRELTETQIKNYITKDQPFACAGSFKVESLGISLFESIESQDPSALIGLPLIKLCNMLKNIAAYPLDNC